MMPSTCAYEALPDKDVHIFYCIDGRVQGKTLKLFLENAPWWGGMFERMI